MFSVFRIPQNNFELPKMLLKCIGISLDENESKSYKLYSIFLLVLVVSYSSVEFSEVLNNLDDFDVITNITLHLIGFYVGKIIHDEYSTHIATV